MAMILVVEDEPMCRELLERLLEFEGHIALSATDGRQALSLIVDRPPDLVLLDLMMPGMDGWTLLALLRGDARWRQLPVIVLSAVADPEKLKAARALGVEDCLLKGQFSYDDLLARIARRLTLPPTDSAGQASLQ